MIPSSSLGSVTLLDTDVLSYRFLARPEFEIFRRSLSGRVLAISFVSYAEALKGAAMAHWGEPRVARYKQHLRTYLIIPADVELASTWGSLAADCRLAGLSVADNDLWIASTAKRWDIPLATRDGTLRRVPGVRFIPESLPPSDT